MKKVLIVTTISGFLPQFELNDVKLLQSMGCEVHYASNFDNPVYKCDRAGLEKMGIHLHHISVVKNPLSLRDNLGAIGEIKKIINDENIFMVHCHNPMGGFTARVAAHLSRRKPLVLYTAHGLHFYAGAPVLNWLLYYPVERILARMTDGIITINKEDYERAKKLSLRNKSNVFQIHGVGVDDTKFSIRENERLSKRREFGIPDGVIHIVTAAELNKNKNQEIVIKAIAELDENRVCYSLCGKGREKRHLQGLINKYHLKGTVRLRGYRNDMDEVLQSADIFAFPSKREGFGVAAVESLLSGVPLIVSDNRGTREYAIDGVNAIVCKENTPEAFAEAINELVKDKEKLGRLRDNCRESASLFTLSEVEKSMKNIYGKILSINNTEM